ncbi:MAG: NADH-quinone oxidoreductase subunit C, partial [Planctomycetota bacterium]|nr:NADH-quinone oxidoreductase subunit C [Planctomycetota bacterium]
MTDPADDILQNLATRFGDSSFVAQPTADGVPTVWVEPGQIGEVLSHLKGEQGGGFRTLLDLTAIDERQRVHRPGQPAAEFTLVYHLLSYDRNRDVRVKAALAGENPSIRTVTDLWACAAWYEREGFDMFGVGFEGHANLRRILM